MFELLRSRKTGDLILDRPVPLPFLPGRNQNISGHQACHVSLHNGLGADSIFVGTRALLRHPLHNRISSSVAAQAQCSAEVLDMTNGSVWIVWRGGYIHVD